MVPGGASAQRVKPSICTKSTFTMRSPPVEHREQTSSKQRVQNPSCYIARNRGVSQHLILVVECVDVLAIPYINDKPILKGFKHRVVLS